MKVLLGTLAIFAAWAGVAPARTVESVPPTTLEARTATRMALEDVAALTDGKLTVSKVCPLRGDTRACVARVRGPVPLRLRVRVWSSADGESWVMRGRRVR